MKQTLRRLIALILAMSMAFSLLSTSVWATDLDGSLAPQSSDESEPQEAEPEASETSDAEDEAEPEEAEDEEDDQEPEAAPEDDQEDDQEPEADDSQEPDDADASDDADDADASDDAEDDADADKGASEDPEEDEDADSLSAQANTPAVIDTAPKVVTSLTYWFEPQELLRSGGSATGGHLKYYVSADPAKPSTDASGWVEDYNNVKKADAGTYYIFYYAKGDSTHSDSEIADPLVCKINPAPVVPDSQSSNPTVHSSVEQVTFNPYFTGGAEEMRYTGAHLYPEVNVKASFFDDEADLTHVGFLKDITDFSITYYKGTSINESNKVTAPKEVGTYTLEITPKGNYTLSNPSYPVTIQFKVIKGLNNLKVNIDNWTYGDAAKAPTVIQNSGGTITYLYKESDADDSTFTDQVPTQAGTYTLKASSAATADYDAAEYRTAFSIFSRLLTVTANDRAITYGAPASNNGVTYSGFVNGENESVLSGTPNITCDYQQGNGVGTYTITPSRGNLSAKNYRFDSKKFYSGTLTVEKKDVTVTAQNQTIDYRDSISQGEVFGTGLLSGHKVSAVLSTSDTEVTDNGTITLSNVVIQDAGNNDVTGNYNIATVNGKLTINPRTISNADVTLDLPAAGYVYDGQSHKPGVTVRDGNTVISAKEYDLVYTEQGKTADSACINAGTYTVTVKFKGNYAGSGDAAANYTIAPKPITVTAPTKYVPYKDALPASVSVDADAIRGALVEGDTVDMLALQVNIPSNATTEAKVGTEFPLTLSQGGSASKNYDVTPVDGKLIITDAPAVITVNPAFVTYDGQKHAPVIKVEDKRPANPIDLLKTAFNYITGQKKEASVYYNTQYALNDTNYSTVGSTELPVGPDVVDRQQVYYYVAFAGNYRRGTDAEGFVSAAVSGETSVTITAKPITVTAKNQAISSTATITPGVDQVDVDTLESGDTLTGVTLIANTDKPGTVNGAILVSNALINSGAGNKNYFITYNPGRLMIRAKQDAPTPVVTARTPNTATVKTEFGVEYVVTDSSAAPAGDDWSNLSGYFKETGSQNGTHKFTGLTSDPHYVHARRLGVEPTFDNPNTPDDESEPGKDPSPVGTKPVAPVADGALTVDYVNESVQAVSGNELKRKGSADAYTDDDLDIDPGDTLVVRVKAKGIVSASDDTDVTLKLRPGAPDAVKLIDITRTDTSLTIDKAVDGQEYLVLPVGSSGAAPVPTKAQWRGDARKPTGGKAAFTGLSPNTRYVVYTRTAADQAAEVFASENSSAIAVSTKKSPSTPGDQDPWHEDTANPANLVVFGEPDYEYLVLPKGGYTAPDWTKADPCPEAFTQEGSIYKKIYTKDSNGTPIEADKDYDILYRKRETNTEMPSNPGEDEGYTLRPAPADGVGYGVDYPAEILNADAGYEVRKNGDTAWADSLTAIPGGNYEVRMKKELNKKGEIVHHESAPTSFTLSQRPVATAVDSADLLRTDKSITINTTVKDQQYVVAARNLNAANVNWDGGYAQTGDGSKALSFSKNQYGSTLTAGDEYAIYTRVPAVATVPATTIAPKVEGHFKSLTKNTETTTKGNPKDPELDNIVKDTTDYTITISGERGYEYLLLPKSVKTPTDDDWQNANPCPADFTQVAANTFERTYEKDSRGAKLTPATGYTVWARKKETDDYMPSNPVKEDTETRKSDQTAPAAPTVEAVGPHAVKVPNADRNLEYRRVGTNDWVTLPDGKTDLVFDGLNPVTKYQVVARKPGDDTHNPSPASAPGKATTPKENQDAPDAPTVVADGPHAVKVPSADPNLEYQLGGTNTWVMLPSGKTDLVFDNLTPVTEYQVVARKPATDTQNASPNSAPGKATTPKEEQSAPVDAPVVEADGPFAVKVLNADFDLEYRLVGTDTYVKLPSGKTDLVFDGLDPVTKYQVVARRPATASQNASPDSKPGEATTPKIPQSKPDAPEAVASSSTTITVTARSGEAYSIDGGLRWKTPENPGDTVIDFKDCTPNKTYQVIAIKPGDATHEVSEISDPTTVTPPKENQGAPAAPAVVADGPHAVKVPSADPNLEYQLGGTNTWVMLPSGKTDLVFDGLDPVTEYQVVARKPETATQNASPASAPGKATTPKEEQVAPVDAPVVVADGPHAVKVPSADPNLEYRLVGTDTYVMLPSGETDLVFDGLDPVTKYQVVARRPKTDTQNASPDSNPGEATTPKIPQSKPDAPEAVASSSTIITVTARSGEAYSIDGGQHWKTPENPGDTVVDFKDCTPNKAYQVIAVKPGDATHEESAISDPTPVTPPKENQEAPAAPGVVADGPHAVKVPSADPNLEYQLGGTNTWVMLPSGKTDLVFDNLTPVTEYQVVARKPETATQNASPNSAPGKATTPKEEQVAPVDAPVVVADGPHAVKVPNADSDLEYRLVGTDTYVMLPSGETDLVFDGLKPVTKYQVVARRPKTDTQNASLDSKPGEATTPKIPQSKPDAPDAVASSPTTITVTARSGEAYSIDGGKTWKTPENSGDTVVVFKDCTPNKAYQVIAIKPGDATHEESAISDPTTVTPPKADQDPPSKPVVKASSPTVVTVEVRSGEEYSIDNGTTWKTPAAGASELNFPGRTPNTQNKVVARKAATATHNASKPSLPGLATTPKATQSAPAAPTVTPVSPTVVKAAVTAGQEYSIDGGKTWKTPAAGTSELSFTGRTPNTTCEVVTRKAETNTHKASPASRPGKATTPKAEQSAPAAPTIHGTDFTSITVKGNSGEEYSIDGGKTWKKPTNGFVTFDKLKQGTTYSIVARKPETATYKVSPVSKPAKATTKKMTEEEVINRGLEVSQTAKQINIKWGKLSSAAGYDVFVQYCGSKFKAKPDVTTNKASATSVKVTKVNGKAIDLKKNFKVYVRAFKLVKGKKVTITQTLQAHVVGRMNTTFTNVNGIKLDNYSFIIKKGKTAKITGRVLLVDPKRKQLSDDHAPQFRFTSANKKVATVNSKGVITAKASGTCTVFVYARNGYAKEVKVQVQ